MGLWSIITGSGKVSDVVDTGLGLVKTAAKGLDALVYTDEEKAVAGAESIAKNMAHAVTFAKIAQSESGASAVTRRVFGLIVLGDFSLFALVGLVFVCLGDMETVKRIVDFAKAIAIGQLAMAVVVSTFGYYAYASGKK